MYNYNLMITIPVDTTKVNNAVVVSFIGFFIEQVENSLFVSKPTSTLHIIEASQTESCLKYR